MNFTDAEQTCKLDNASLVIPKSGRFLIIMHIESHIELNLKKNFYEIFKVPENDFMAKLLPNQNFWIGLSVNHEDNYFISQDGAKLNFTYWANNEQDSVMKAGGTVVNWEHQNQWTVDDLSQNYPFVCSMPNSDTGCWNYYPGTYTLGWTSHGSALIDNINDAVKKCELLGVADCGAVHRREDLGGWELRRGTELRGFRDPQNNIHGIWLRKDNFDDCETQLKGR